jgi:hypothetical protein
MKKSLSNFQVWLSILILISIWIILSVDLDVLPLIPSNFSKDFVIKLNQVFTALSYSILAAFIFYWFTYIFPRKLLIYRSKKILAQQVHWLLYELFVLINQILNAYDIKKRIEEIEEKDLLHIDGNISKTFDGYYSTSEHWKKIRKNGKQFTGLGDMNFTFPEIVINKLNKIPELILKIRNSNPNFHTDETFAEILSSIETNKIIEWYANKKYDIFQLEGSSRELHSMIVDYNRLLGLKYHRLFRNSYQTIHFYSEEEIKAIPEKRNQFHTKLASKVNSSRSLNPCIVYSSKYSDSRAIISELNKGGFLTTQGLQKKFLLSEFADKITPPNESRCLVIIGHDIPQKQIKEYIKKNKSKKIIIWLKSNFIYSTRKIEINENLTDFGLYKLFYRRPFSILKFCFGRNYPTKEIISILRFNVVEIMRNYRNEK